MSDLVGNPEDRFSRVAAHLWSNPQFSLLFKGKGNVEVMYFKLGTYLP